MHSVSQKQKILWSILVLIPIVIAATFLVLNSASLSADTNIFAQCEIIKDENTRYACYKDSALYSLQHEGSVSKLFLAAGTLGRRIFDGAKSAKIFGQTVSIRCGVRAIGGYSAHADQKTLYRWVRNIKQGGKLKKIFAVQGEEGPALDFVQLVRDHLGVDAEAPMAGDRVEL